MTTRPTPAPRREPRPLKAFFVSLGISAALLGVLLVSDGRVMELRKAKAEVRELDRRIADEQRENTRLNAAIEAANKEEFPAEKVAREELNLVHPEDVVLLYPEGSLTKDKPAPGSGSDKKKAAPRTPSPEPTRGH
ncbi:MAG TPA: septum formation initiator family protein [Thermoanaerobaculia bacterium]